MNLLDIILLLLLAWAVFRGYKRGVVGTLSTLAGYVLSLIGTAVFYWPLQIFLSRQLHLVEKLSPWVVNNLGIPAASQPITSFPIDMAVEMVNQKDIPYAFKEIMVKYIQDFADLPVKKGINSLGEGIGYIVSDFMISAFSFVFLAVVLSVFFRILLPRLFNSAAPRPVTALDKAGGAAFGLAGGFLSIAALVLLLTPLASIGALKGNPSPLADQVHTSFMVNAVVARLETLFEMIFASKGF
jgi:uncharacterized membrane protein required for colicin V production